MLRLSLLALPAVVSWCALVAADDTDDLTYHSKQARREAVQGLHEAFGNLTRLEIVGKVANSPVYVLVISRTPRRQFLVPRVHLLANFPAGSELLIKLASYLLHEYGRNEAVARVVNSSEIHILFWLEPATVSENPKDDCSADDHGRELEGFPDYFDEKSDKFTDQARMPEQVQLVMQWLKRGSFVLGAHVRGGDGGIAVAYGFHNSAKDSPSEAPDEDVMRNLSISYADHNQQMKRGTPICPGGHLGGFPGGIINAAAWKRRPGLMQDYAYVREGTVTVDLALSCCRVPSEGTLRRLWMENKHAIIHLLGQVQRAIRGYIKGPDGTHIPGALLTIRERNVGFRSTDQGEFWRLLQPGTYTLVVSAKGYLPTAVTVNVPEHAQQEAPIAVVMRPSLYPARILPIDSYSTEKAIPEKRGGSADTASTVGAVAGCGLCLLVHALALCVVAACHGCSASF
ncbi:carboxypeptidase D-like [Dermacentor andersoni]|uniref:carboxypeptidase D-like n=1 Tax=Dermacentor andersoni TaxID=34620 RepID=UPI002154F950|nr:carboxypeptidase D-like [Dermacentor andersoni]